MKAMVDTIKLLISILKPLDLDGSGFVPTISELVNSTKYGKAVLNPSVGYANMGKYMPRLTMFKRPSKSGPVYQLAVEFSAPKMLFNNNFDELTDKDYEPLLADLQEKLYELTKHRFFKGQLAQSSLGAWHASKNIVFLDYTSCQTVLNAISKVDISRVYDWQKTDFRDGHELHIHCNSLDIAFYDKMADLRKSKQSEKRALENDNRMQLSLLDSLAEYKPLEVLRYEVRLVGTKAIKRAFPELTTYTLETLFKQKLCQNLLLNHWQKITKSVDLLALDVKQPYELLQNYITENPDARPQTALAAVAGLLIVSQAGAVKLRNILEARYGSQAWHRIKPLLKSPQGYRFTHFQRIDEVLSQFIPTRMSDFLAHIENTGK